MGRVAQDWTGSPEAVAALLRRIADQLTEYLVVDPKTGCWNWVGVKIGEQHRNGGYGLLLVNGRQRRVHRLIWEIIHGSIPSDRESDHTCENRSCAYPRHVEVVTHLENVRRGKRGRNEITWKKPLCECGRKRVYRGYDRCYPCRMRTVASLYACGHPRTKWERRCRQCGRAHRSRRVPLKLFSVRPETLVQWKEIWELRESGLKLREIADIRGVSHQAVQQTISKVARYFGLIDSRSRPRKEVAA